MVASVVTAAVADGLMTFLWVVCASTLGAVTTVIASHLDVQTHFYANLAITTSLIVALVLVFDLVGAVLGGASFNPTANASFYAAGVGKDDLLSMAIRFPAQALGAVGGALAIVEFMPKDYKHMLEGPSLKVDIHSGAIAESVLTFIITFLVLCIILKGPKSAMLRAFLLAVCTVAVIVPGSGYTGPSLNPVNAFGWAYINKRHLTWEQFYVYWICPFVGSILAAWAFRVLFPSQVKVKKA